MPKGSGGGGSGGRSGGGGGANQLSSDEVSSWSKGGGEIKASGNVDISKPVTITMSGKTYDHRSSLKDNGFKFNSGDKTWSKTVTGSKNDIRAEIHEASRPRRADRDMVARLSN